jgi:transcriptional regulator with XRE-family HTH domain
LASETLPLLRYIGPALRLLRRKSGERQVEIARRAGVTKQMLSGYERSKRLPSLRTLAKLLGALDARLLDLGRFVDYVEQAHR